MIHRLEIKLVAVFLLLILLPSLAIGAGDPCLDAFEAAGDPDSDAARLLFADYIDERGEEPMAAFIRAQIERHQLEAVANPSESLKKRIEQLKQREDELQRKYEDQWLKGIRYVNARFVRGFLDHIEVDLDSLESLADEKRSEFCRLRSVEVSSFRPPGSWPLPLSYVSERLERFTQTEWGHLERLGISSLTGGCLDGDTLRLVLSLRAPNLTRLGLRDLEGDWERVLAEWPGLAKIDQLALWGTTTNRRFNHFIRSPALKDLRSIDLSHLEMDHRDSRAFFESPSMSKLQVLYIGTSLDLYVWVEGRIQSFRVGELPDLKRVGMSRIFVRRARRRGLGLEAHTLGIELFGTDSSSFNY